MGELNYGMASVRDTPPLDKRYRRPAWWCRCALIAGGYSSRLGYHTLLITVSIPLLQERKLLLGGVPANVEECFRIVFVRAKGLTGHDDQPIRRSALHRLLTNPFYTGVIVYKGQKRQGIHSPLIAAKLYATARANLAARAG